MPQWIAQRKVAANTPPAYVNTEPAPEPGCDDDAAPGQTAWPNVWVQQARLASCRSSRACTVLLPVALLMATVLLSTCGKPVDLEQLPIMRNLGRILGGPAMLAASAGVLDQGFAVREGSPASRVRTFKLTRNVVPGPDDPLDLKVAYWMPISVGSPALQLRILCDTGSGHLIVPSAYCKSAACKARTRYRRSASASAVDVNTNGATVTPGVERDELSIEFGTGAISGVFVNESVCLGEGSCAQMGIVAATDMTDSFLPFDFDGILGLSLSGLAGAPMFNFVDTVVPSLTRHLRVFSLALGPGALDDAKITFGGWDEGRMGGALIWNPVVRPDLGFWMVKINAILVDGEAVDYCSDGCCSGIVDSGASAVGVPSAAFLELFSALRRPAEVLAEGESGTPAATVAPCEGAGPRLQFELELSTLELGPQQYALPVVAPRSPAHASAAGGAIVAAGAGLEVLTAESGSRQGGMCKPNLMIFDFPAAVGSKVFLLGQPLLSRYLAVFDAEVPRLGFAELKAP